jgi:phage shock protein PspC (stress-responsive transcriptional regulator)
MTAPSPRLRRSRSDALLGGVCAGIARSAGLDPLLLRIALVAITVLTGGAGVPAYLAAWVLIPREPEPGTLPTGADRPGPPLQRVTGTAAGPAVDSSGTGAGRTADVRAAWSTAGSDLRSLAAEVRRPRAGTAPPSAASGSTGGPTGTGTSSPVGDTAPTETTPTNSTATHTTPTGTTPTGTTPTDPTPSDPAEQPASSIPSPRSPLTAADDAATALGERLRAPEVQAGARRAAASVSQALTASVDELGRRIRRESS